MKRRKQEKRGNEREKGNRRGDHRERGRREKRAKGNAIEKARITGGVQEL